MKILKSLPIWPIHSSKKKERFIDAASGILYPLKIEFFSFQKNTNFYKCDESDFNTLNCLNAKEITILKYVEDYLLPGFIVTSTPSQKYVDFLQKVLSLNKPEIGQCFVSKQVIPNKSLTAFVSANTLYDMENLLFRKIFDESDKFLPLKLQNDSDCLEALKRIGLKHQMNHNIFIECAQEIESQINHNRIPVNLIKDRAKDLIIYLYEHINTLNFNREQWNKILGIKFVPSEKNLSSQFYHVPKETLGFETFRDLCSPEYKDVCWIQCPLFD